MISKNSQKTALNAVLVDCMYICTYVYVYMYLCIYVYMYVCIYVYV